MLRHGIARSRFQATTTTTTLRRIASASAKTKRMLPVLFPTSSSSGHHHHERQRRLLPLAVVRGRAYLSSSSYPSSSESSSFLLEEADKEMRMKHNDADASDDKEGRNKDLIVPFISLVEVAADSSSSSPVVITSHPATATNYLEMMTTATNNLETAAVGSYNNMEHDGGDYGGDSGGDSGGFGFGGGGGSDIMDNVGAPSTMKYASSSSSTTSSSSPSSASSSSQPGQLVLIQGKSDKSWLLFDPERRPVGTLNPDEWQTLRSAFLDGGHSMRKLNQRAGAHDDQYHDPHDDAFNLLEHGFALLDRMAAERQARIKQAANSTASNMLSGSSEFKEQDFVLPVVDRPWVLFLWRNIIIQQEQQQQQKRKYNNNQHHHHHGVLEPLSLPLVVDKLSTYMELGLLPWTNTSIMYLLDVIKHCPNLVHPKQAPILAMDIVTRLEQSAAASAAEAATAAIPVNLDDDVALKRSTRLLFARNIVLTTQLINLWTKSRHVDAPYVAMKLLQESKETFRLLQQHDQVFGDHHELLLDYYRPDAHLYVSVMHAWAKASSLSSSSSSLSIATLAPQQVVDLLMEAQRDYDIQPTTLLYNSVIHAITHPVEHPAGCHEKENRAFDLHMLREARKVLDVMITKYQQQQGGKQQQTPADGDGTVVDGDGAVVQVIPRSTSVVQVMPRSDSYSSILAAYMRVGQLRQALNLLHDMQDLASLDPDDNNCKEISPSDYCLQTVLGPLQECIAEHHSSIQPLDDEQEFQPAAEYLQSLYHHHHREDSASVSPPIDILQILPTLDQLSLQVATSPALLDLHGDVLLYGGDEKISIVSSLVDMALQTWEDKQQQQQHHHHHHHHQKYPKKRHGQVDTRCGILKRLDHYQQVGLLQPTNATLDWMISSLASTAKEKDATLSSSVALRAQEVIDIARQACRSNVHDTLYHPNHIPMTRLAQLWGKTTTATTTAATEPNRECRITVSNHHQQQQQQQQQQPSYYTAPHLAAEATLTLLKDWYHETNQRIDMKPDVPIYIAVVRTLIRHGPDKDQVAHRAMELLQECMNSYDSGQKLSGSSNQDQALVELYSSVLKALLRSSMVEQALAFFLNLSGMYLSSTKATTPDKCAAAMATIAAAAAKISATTVKQPPLVLQPCSLRPTPKMMSVLVSAYTRQQRPDLADDFLRTMEKLCQETVDAVFLPDAICYNKVSTGYAQAKQPEKAEATIQRILHMAIATTSTTQTDAAVADQGMTTKTITTSTTQTDAAVADQGVTTKTITTSSTQTDAAVANQVKMMPGEGPDTRHLSAVVDALRLSRSPDAFDTAVGVVKVMTDLQAQSPGLKTKPDRETLASLLQFVLESEKKDEVPEKAETVLMLMHQQWRIDHDDSVKPDANIYSEIIAAWGNSSRHDAHARLDALLYHMQSVQIQPNRHCFVNTMSAYLKQGRPEKVQAQFHAMENRSSGVGSSSSSEPTTRPSSKNYLTLIETWAEADQPAHATTILNELLAKKAARRIYGRIYASHFSSVVRAWTRSPRPDAAEQAEQLLNVMEHLSSLNDKNRRKSRYRKYLCRPDTDTYASVIAAHANSGQADAAERAEMLLKRLKTLYSATGEKARPNLAVFSEVLRAHVAANVSVPPSPTGNNTTLVRIKTLLDDVRSLPDSAWQNQHGKAACAKLMESIQLKRYPEKQDITRQRQLDDLRSLPDSAWQNQQGKAACAKLMESKQMKRHSEKDWVVQSVQDITRQRQGGRPIDRLLGIYGGA